MPGEVREKGKEDIMRYLKGRTVLSVWGSGVRNLQGYLACTKPGVQGFGTWGFGVRYLGFRASGRRGLGV